MDADSLFVFMIAVDESFTMKRVRLELEVGLIDILREVAHSTYFGGKENNGTESTPTGFRLGITTKHTSLVC